MLVRRVGLGSPTKLGLDLFGSGAAFPCDRCGTASSRNPLFSQHIHTHTLGDIFEYNIYIYIYIYIYVDMYVHPLSKMARPLVESYVGMTGSGAESTAFGFTKADGG